MPLFASRAARRRLGLSPDWFGGGGLEVEEIGRARELAAAVRDAGQPAVGGAALVALDRLAAAFDELTSAYLTRVGEDLFERALELLGERLGRGPVAELLLRFGEEFDLARPPAATGSSAPRPAAPGEAARLLRRLLLFWVLDGNPAAAPIVATLHDTSLRGEPLYGPAIAVLREFFEGVPGVEEGGPSLVECLLEPSRTSPGSLAEQLRFLHRRWNRLLERLAERLLRGVDLLEEEEAPRFGPGPGPAEVPSFEGEWVEERSFSADTDWMPRLVLLAKNAYVWLDQLSRQAQRPLRRLDEIPGEVLDRLAARGFTGLWLIGVWERSPASARIKRLCGNPEAIGSAYSLRRYRIAAELGGDEALEALRDRAERRGIRLAADMVPNHMGIDSDWLLEHPDWFVGLDHCPYPNYTFDGPDLSPDPRVGIYLEDHYYDRSDAAVVFKRVDRESGRVRYIYHGNDGTSTPWNDTAQLDFLRPEVREAVIGVILDVTRRFRVIRFDAAMTLTKRHYQRLWFPPPGGGGAIPTRAENGLTTEEFNAAMPTEFWRDVVDRAAREAPDTLLLAEAFWLMEGYFVRSLGMHRVYNSAFMNMLRDGETGHYRRLIKETLAFDPEILKRYVNFMSNPDERTAVDQFGDDDRFFGVSALLATMPGLPMFAHGQFEGLREKYGMEYQRAYWNETPNQALVARNEREISPLLRHRHRFAGVEKFRLYDLVEDGRGVNDDVLVYSNGSGAQTSLTVFHNRFAETRGWISESAPYRPRAGESEELVTSRLADAVGIEGDPREYVRFRDAISGNEFLVAARQLRERGLELSLRAYEYRVLHDFRRLADDPRGSLARLSERLAGGGVPSLERALSDLAHQPLHRALGELLAPSLLSDLLAPAVEELRRPADDRLLDKLRAGLEAWLGAASAWTGSQPAAAPAVGTDELAALVTLPVLARRLATARAPETRRTGRRLERALERHPALLAGLYGWLALRALPAALPDTAGAGRPLEELGLATPLIESLTGAGVARPAAERLSHGLRAAARIGWGGGERRGEPRDASTLSEQLLQDEAGRALLGAHPSGGEEWVEREGVELAADLLLGLEALAWNAASGAAGSERIAELTGWARRAARLDSEAESAGYRVDRLRAALSDGAEGPEASEGSESIDETSTADSEE